MSGRARTTALATVLLATTAFGGGRDEPSGGSASLAASEKVFAARCASCHGPAGLSDTPDARALKVAPLAGHPRLAGMSVAAIAAAVKENAKHRGIAPLDDADIEAAAPFVKHVAGRK
jgi:mono/diheme cytochrome c family protein